MIHYRCLLRATRSSYFFVVKWIILYVSNSEMKDGHGRLPVIALEGNAVEYMDKLRRVQEETKFASSPDLGSAHFLKRERIRLGKDRSFDTVACNDRDLSKPVFHLTEDTKNDAF
ncbi:hypothetical protein ACHAW6_005722 [Cyclotella cf. meneghiniana]